MPEEPAILWEPGGTEAETSAGTARRYRKPLRSLRWSDFKVLLFQTIDKFYAENAPRLGASVAFYTMLSMAPLLVVAIWVAGFAFGEQAAKGQIFWQLQTLVGPDGAMAIQRLVENARKPSVGIVPSILGLLTLFFGATTAVAELRSALNEIWDVPARSTTVLQSALGLLRERFFSFAMVVGVGFLLLVSLLVNAALAAANQIIGFLIPIPETFLQLSSSIVSFVVITLLFALIYKVLPDLKIEWRDVLLGSVVTSALFTAGKLAIGVYLGKTALASTYGAAGSLVIVLVWVYYSAQVFFLGAVFTNVFACNYGSGMALKSKRVILGARK